MPDKIVNHFVLADGSTARYAYDSLYDSIDKNSVEFTLMDVPCERGGWSRGSKDNSSPTLRLRISNPIKVSKGDWFINDGGTIYGVGFSDGETGAFTDSGWLINANTKYTVPADGAVCIAMRKNETVITDDEIDTLRAGVTACLRYSEVVYNDNKSEYITGNTSDILNANRNGDDCFDVSLFAQGTVDSGNYLQSPTFRVATPDIQEFDRFLEIKADAGYRFGLHFFNSSDIFVLDAGWQTSYVVPPHQRFRMVIAEQTENTQAVYRGVEWALVQHIKFKELAFDYAEPQKYELTNAEKESLFAYGFTWYSDDGTTVFKSNAGTASSTIRKITLPVGSTISVDIGYKFKYYSFPRGSNTFTHGGNNWHWMSSSAFEKNLVIIVQETADFYICVDDESATGMPVNEIVPHLHIVICNSAEWVRGIEQRTTTIENEISGDNYPYTIIGDKLTVEKQRYITTEMSITSTPDSQIEGAYSNQGMSICNGVVFQLYSNDKVELIDYNTGASIAILTIKCDHGDTIDFSNEYYAEGDEFPLAYITADTTPAKVYVNRITRTGTTLVKTYIFPADKTGYFAGHALDYLNKVIYQIGYTENSYYQDPNGTNYLIVSKWDLKNVTDNGDDTFTPAFVESFTIPFYTTLQGQAYFNGKIIAISSHWENVDTKVLVIDATSKGLVSVIDSFPSSIKNVETEGVAFVPDGDKYSMVLKTNNTKYYKVDFS